MPPLEVDPQEAQRLLDSAAVDYLVVDAHQMNPSLAVREGQQGVGNLPFAQLSDPRRERGLALVVARDAEQARGNRVHEHEVLCIGVRLERARDLAQRTPGARAPAI